MLGFLLYIPLVAQGTPLESDLHLKLEAQEARILELERMIKALTAKTSPAPESSVDEKTEDSATLKKGAEYIQPPSSVNVGYDKGFFIAHQQEKEDLFKLKINGRMQFRYTGFSKDNGTFRFDNGRTGSQRNINDFEIERGRLEFRGDVVNPKLHFYLNLDFDTDDNHDVKAHDFWFNYDFDKAFNLYAGKAFVPGSREWLDGSTTTHLVDRSLATSFFRPDRSIGLWAIGEPAESFHYRVMLANGFNTTDLEREDIDNNFTYSGSVWGDIVGDYGNGRADLEWHEDLAVRVGGSFTYSPVDTSGTGEPIGEADAIRLSDGTRLDAEGALAPGISVNEFDISLYALDLALKYQGVSINSEWYYRSIDDLRADAGGSFSEFSDTGMYIDVGYFLVPATLEAVARYSMIDGELSNAQEYAVGLNYFVDGTHLNKFTFDISQIDTSPVSSSGPNYFVGADGVLYRLQWQVGF